MHPQHSHQSRRSEGVCAPPCEHASLFRRTAQRWRRARPGARVVRGAVGREGEGSRLECGRVGEDARKERRRGR
eukprot:6214036-Pleurochrysis_carterae.AAC.4